ncbi:MAG: homoserine O-acetyltransferase family protein [Candidatus Binataceae bacterium]
MMASSGFMIDNDPAIVEVKNFATRNFVLENGQTLPDLNLTYEAYGRLGADADNAILITHGYTSSQHAAGRDRSGEPGWWDGMIGPAKTIDTRRYFVICSNMIGSSYGSTGPASVNPETGKPYGLEFPAITVADMVRAQHLLLGKLGVSHLVAVAGPSYGGYQAFQWAVSYPREMDGVVAVVTAPSVSGGDAMVADLRARFSAAPGWNRGRYYESGGMRSFMTEFRIATLKRYGLEVELANSFPEVTAREAALRRLAEKWADEFDPNSLIVLAQARAHFNAERDFSRIQAKLLYVLSRTDNLFPPALAAPVMAKLKAAGVDATYFQLDSDKGHLASGLDWMKWAPVLRDFLSGLAPA